MGYENYTVRDFALDPGFQEWVKKPDAASEAFWEQWKKDHPEKIETLNEARQWVLVLDFQDENFSPEFVNAIWKNIQSGINQSEPSYSYKTGLRKARERKLKRWMPGIAAAITLLFLVNLGVYLVGLPYYTTYQSAYGSTKTVVLPDSSQVTLNANSSIKIRHHFLNPFWINDFSEKRKVWMSGEAYFDVKESGPSYPFVVHSTKAEIRVLGTEFNVNNRGGKVQVVLNEGSVQFLPSLEKGLGAKQDNLIHLKPGDLVEIGDDKKILRKKVNPQHYSMWKEHKLFFEKTPLSRVTRSVEEFYGVKIRIEDPGLAQSSFTGTLHTEDKQNLFATLEAAFGIKITKVNDKYILKK